MFQLGTIFCNVIIHTSLLFEVKYMKKISHTIFLNDEQMNKQTNKQTNKPHIHFCDQRTSIQQY